MLARHGPGRGLECLDAFNQECGPMSAATTTPTSYGLEPGTPYTVQNHSSLFALHLQAAAVAQPQADHFVLPCRSDTRYPSAPVRVRDGQYLWVWTARGAAFFAVVEGVGPAALSQ